MDRGPTIFGGWGSVGPSSPGSPPRPNSPSWDSSGSDARVPRRARPSPGASRPGSPCPVCPESRLLRPKTLTRCASSPSTLRAAEVALRREFHGCVSGGSGPWIGHGVERRRSRTPGSSTGGTGGESLEVSSRREWCEAVAQCPKERSPGPRCRSAIHGTGKSLLRKRVILPVKGTCEEWPGMSCEAQDVVAGSRACPPITGSSAPLEGCEAVQLDGCSHLVALGAPGIAQRDLDDLEEKIYSRFNFAETQLSPGVLQFQKVLDRVDQRMQVGESVQERVAQNLSGFRTSLSEVADNVQRQASSIDLTFVRAKLHERAVGEITRRLSEAEVLLLSVAERSQRALAVAEHVREKLAHLERRPEAVATELGCPKHFGGMTSAPGSPYQSLFARSGDLVAKHQPQHLDLQLAERLAALERRFVSGRLSDLNVESEQRIETLENRLAALVRVPEPRFDAETLRRFESFERRLADLTPVIEQMNQAMHSDDGWCARLEEHQVLLTSLRAKLDAQYEHRALERSARQDWEDELSQAHRRLEGEVAEFCQSFQSSREVLDGMAKLVTKMDDRVAVLEQFLLQDSAAGWAEDRTAEWTRVAVDSAPANVRQQSSVEDMDEVKGCLGDLAASMAEVSGRMPSIDSLDCRLAELTLLLGHVSESSRRSCHLFDASQEGAWEEAAVTNAR